MKTVPRFDIGRLRACVAALGLTALIALIIGLATPAVGSTGRQSAPADQPSGSEASVVDGAIMVPSAVAIPAAPPSDLFICTGGPATDNFVADAHFSGGTVPSKSSALIDTSLLATVIPQTVLQSERYGAMIYTIPGCLAGKPYTVTLYFVETWATGASLRTFNVGINGTSVLSNFDIFATAGAMYKAVQKSFAATADASGRIVIAFTNGSANNPKIDGIAITTPPNALPTITTIADQSIDCNASTGALCFTVGDAETPVANLTLAASSSAPAIVPPANIVLGGSGANRTVTVTPAVGQSGTATIGISVGDDSGGTSASQFKVRVQPNQFRPHNFIDRNGDGIPDVWAALYPNAGGIADDPDGDGQNNIEEGQAGTDPFSGASRFSAAAALDSSGNLVVRWFGISGKHYYLESSTDLRNWSPLAVDHIGNGAEISVIVRPSNSPAIDACSFWHVVRFDMDTTGGGLTDWEKTHMDLVATVAAIDGANGRILSPFDSRYLAKGDSLAFAIVPAAGYAIDQVLVDGQSVGAVSAYTFSNISAGTHSIAATFKPDGDIRVSPTVVDLDGPSTLTVFTIGAWTATSDQPWLMVTPASGVGNGTITVSGGQNMGTTTRYAVINVNVLGGSVPVHVTQQPVSNLALGKTAMASSTEGTYTASNAVDASATTRWSSLPTDSQWIAMDLGGVFSIKQVVLKWENAFGKAYKIEVSMDGALWCPIYSTMNGAGGVETLNVAGGGRYVRMNGSARGTSWGYSLFDFQVIGKRAGHYLSVSPATVNVPAYGTGASIAVSSDMPWAATSSHAWLTVVPASGTGDGRITLTATSITTGSRTATVTFTAPSDPSLTQVVSVTQSGDGVVPLAVSINPSITYQQIEGFGGTGGRKEVWYAADQNDLWSDQFGAMVIDDLGVNIVRTAWTAVGYYDASRPIEPQMASDSRTYISYMSKLVTYAQAHNRSVKAIVTLWSPPGNLKDNNNINNGGHLLPAKYPEFAKWMVGCLDMYAAAGVEVYGISPTNEPKDATFYESCLYSPQEYMDMIKYVAPVIKAKYPNVKIMGPESMVWEFASGPGTHEIAVMNDDQANKCIDIFTTHFYDRDILTGHNDPANEVAYSKNYWAALKGSGKPLWETEVCGWQPNWQEALLMGGSMHTALTVANLGTYLYWSLGSFGSPGTVPEALIYGEQKGPLFHVFRHFSRYIQEGYTRVDANTSESQLKVSAYIHKDRKEIAVVLINEKDTALTIQLNGVTGGGLNRVSSDANGYARELGSLNAAGDPIELAPKSITTLYGSY